MRWIVEHINHRLCQETCATFIGIFDFPGFQDTPSNGLYNLLYNYSTEKTISLATGLYFDKTYNEFDESGLTYGVRPTYKNNADLLTIMESRTDVSIFSLIDTESLKSSKDKKAEDKIAQDIISQFVESGTVVLTRKRETQFTIKHTLGSVDYSTDKFKFRNTDAMSTDFVNLARGDKKDCPPSDSAFFQELFADKLVMLERYAKNETDFLNAQSLLTPTRKPSMKRKPKVHGDDPLNLFNQATLTRNFQSAFDELLDTISCAKPWFVFCIKPNDTATPSKIEDRKLEV